VIPAYSYELVCRELAHAFGQRSRALCREHVRMTGLLFARPSSPLAKDEIIPSIEYYHHRSGDRIDFFCSGYGAYWEGLREEFPDQVIVAPGKDPDWLFSAQKFNAFRAEIESMTMWKYSGGVDLLLANAIYDSAHQTASIDFSSLICCQLDRMKQDGAIQSVETFFERVFQFADAQSGNDPTWGFSGKQELRVAGSALKRVVLSLLPRKLGDDAARAFHFAVVDVSRSAQHGDGPADCH